jgi:hypothetical protein
LLSLVMFTAVVLLLLLSLLPEDVQEAILILDHPVLATIPSTMNPTGTAVMFVLFVGPMVNVLK